MSVSAEHNHAKERVAVSSVIASAVMTGGKLVVGLMTGSMGILSEAAHSLLDMGAAVITYFAVRASGLPPDKEHPYGHGKIESISALAETALLFLTSAWIIYEAVSRLVRGGVEIEVTWYACAVIIVSIAIDYSRSRALMRVARETKSQALEADALHFRSDIWSSAVVLVGLLATYLGYPGADSVAALCVACFVLRIGYQMGKRTFDTLIDTAPDGVEQSITEALRHVPGIISVERVRVRTMGAELSVDAIIGISRKHHGETVREIVEGARTAIQAHHTHADVLIHTQSVADPSETAIETIYVLAAKEHHLVHNVVVDVLREKMFVSYDLEVLAHCTLTEGHAIATAFEERVRAELGGNPEINTHIDPTYHELIASAVIDKDGIAAVEQAVHTAIAQVPELHHAHHLKARRLGEKLFVSVHCTAPGTYTIEEAHGYAETLEHHILRSNPTIVRALVHVEPE